MRSVIFLFCACLVASVSLLGVGALSRSASQTLIPSAVPAVRAAHQVHAKHNIDCAKCHQKVNESTRSNDVNTPKMSACESCHDAAKKSDQSWTSQCAYCHLRNGEYFLAQGHHPAPNINFSHRAHKSLGCQQCHQWSKDGTLKPYSMKRCLTCHQSNKNKRRLSSCRVCHHVHPNGIMKTRFKDKLLLPPVWMAGKTHGVDWTGNHAKTAGRDSGFCANCHRESQCQQCHAGRMKPTNIHPSDWLSIHGTHSTIDNPRCMSCHKTQGFCLSCHRRAGVAPDAPVSKRSSRPAKFHRGTTPAKICKRARTNIAACASCHSESSCISCHRAINPHPVGFGRRCKKLAKHNRRACAKCHNGNVEQLCR